MSQHEYNIAVSAANGRPQRLVSIERSDGTAFRDRMDPNFTTTVVGDDDYVATHDSTQGRNEWTKTRYDVLGRVFRSERYPGTQDSNHFETNNYYDRNGRLVCTGDKYSAHTEYAYDGAGRQYGTRTVTDVAATPYTSGKFQYRQPQPNPVLASATGGNDGLIEGRQLVYGAPNTSEAELVVTEHRIEVNHNDTDGFSSGATADKIVTTEHRWYDGADRLVTVGNYGSGTTTWQLASPPARSAFGSRPTASGATVLVTEYEYNAASGRQETMTDPNNIVTKTFYDDLGRRTHVAENYVNYVASSDTDAGGGTNNQEDRVTKWLYNGLDQVTQLTAVNVTSGGPVNELTKYLYRHEQNASLVTETIYPDSTNTDHTGTDQVKITYNLDGTPATRTDQRGVVIEYMYNSRRQLEAEKATTIPSGVYGGASESDAVRSIIRTYDALGRLTNIVSANVATGSGAILNQVQHVYGSHGQITHSHQDHTDVVGVGTAHQTVQYAYDESATSNVYDDGLRLETVTYPDARVIFYGYGGTGTSTAFGDRLDRVHEIRETNSAGLQLTQYSYNGTNRLAIADYLDPDVKLDLYGGTSGTYAGFDRFGRTIDQRWVDYTSGTVDIDRIKYGYDFASNRQWREDTVAATNGQNHDEYYTYDGLHRLKSADRGNLTGIPYSGVASKNFAQDFTLDQLGNWPTFKQDDDGNGTWDLNQSRAHNKVNEIDTNDNDADGPGASITASSGANWADPLYDKAGNMTTMPDLGNHTSNLLMKYDAWNRLITISNVIDGELYRHEYDGLGQRIRRQASPALGGAYVNYFYNELWQVIEERANGDVDPLAQYVWHPYYVDALAVRYWDSNIDGDYLDTNEGAHYYCQDANFNVTAIVRGSGISSAALERYIYTPYGKVTVLDSNFALDAGNASDIGNTCLFTGRELDPVGLQLNRNRYYAWHLGRWVNRDPIEYEGSEWNLYEYVGGQPTGYADPTGERHPVRLDPGLPGTGVTPEPNPGINPPNQSPQPPAETPSPGLGTKILRCCKGAATGVARCAGAVVSVLTTPKTAHAPAPYWMRVDVPGNDPPDDFDHCRDEYEKCLQTVMSTWEGKQRNRCWNCYLACQGIGFWRGRMNGLNCAYWDTERLPE